MKPVLALLIGSVVLLALPSLSHAKNSKRHAETRIQGSKGHPAPSSSARNINVPSTDFSTVEQAGEGADDRSTGGSIRPSMTDSGQLGLGAGF